MENEREDGRLTRRRTDLDELELVVRFKNGKMRNYDII